MVVIVVSSSVLFSLIIPTSDFLSLDRGWGGNGGGVEGPKWDDILGLIEGERGRGRWEVVADFEFSLFLSFFLSLFLYLFPCARPSFFGSLFIFFLQSFFHQIPFFLTLICPLFSTSIYNHYTYSQNFSSINIIPTTLEYNGDWKSYYFYVLKRHKILGFP